MVKKAETKESPKAVKPKPEAKPAKVAESATHKAKSTSPKAEIKKEPIKVEKKEAVKPAPKAEKPKVDARPAAISPIKKMMVAVAKRTAEPAAPQTPAAPAPKPATTARPELPKAPVVKKAEEVPGTYTTLEDIQRNMRKPSGAAARFKFFD